MELERVQDALLVFGRGSAHYQIRQNGLANHRIGHLHFQKIEIQLATLQDVIMQKSNRVLSSSYVGHLTLKHSLCVRYLL